MIRSGSSRDFETGSATAITQIIPELAGKLNGLAVRVPLTNASIVDCVFEVSRATTAEEVNAVLKAASDRIPGILGFEERTLVSTDYVNDPRSGVVDAACTMVTDGTMVKIYAWYDNEWGYALRLVDVARRTIPKLPTSVRTCSAPRRSSRSPSSYATL